ncbi:MAG: hypothetical protein JO027_11415 [Solirubrobacterales bacterium]|nr:hypothetical protein [Solirubrobacterales bacterium]
MSPGRKPLRFGVFPLGIAGTPDGLATGPLDDPDRIAGALEQLRGGGRPWLVRMYVVWTGPDSTARCLEELGRLAAHHWDLDVVLSYKDPTGDVDAWLGLVAETVTTWGNRLSTLQITGEANLTGGGDGDFPRVGEALVRGVIDAAAVKVDRGSTVEIGFAAAHDSQPESCFLWPQVRELGGSDFAAAVDYAGIDMYPDVFGPPMTLERLGGAVGLVLRVFRERVLEPIGIGLDVPVHVCENGWPTGSHRSAERQAACLETLVRSIDAVSAELNVTHWELFTLRDADSSKDDLFHQFGVLSDDYTPKPAFEQLAKLYSELG